MKDDKIFTPSNDSTLHDVEFCSKYLPLSQNNCSIRLTLLQSLQAFNSWLHNDQCLNSAIQFYCNATQVPCDDNNTFILGLQEQCIQVRDNDCAVEWREYENCFDTLLPNCTSFAEDGNLTLSKDAALVCPKEFDLYCDSFCLASCEDFYLLSKNTISGTNVVVVIVTILGLLGSIFTLIVCILNRRKM